MKYGDTRTSKASPIKWLRYFLSQYSPLATPARTSMFTWIKAGNSITIQQFKISSPPKVMRSDPLELKLLSKMDLSSELTGPSLILFEPSSRVQTLLSNFGPMHFTMPCGFQMHSQKQATIDLPSNWLTPMARLKTYPTSTLFAAELG